VRYDVKVFLGIEEYSAECGIAGWLRYESGCFI